MHSYTNNLTDRYSRRCLKDTVWFCFSNGGKFAVFITMLPSCLLWCYHTWTVWYLVTEIYSSMAEKIFSRLASYEVLFFEIKTKITKLIKMWKLRSTLKNLIFSVYVRAPSVLILCDGILGSPVPKVFVAIIRNSYSIHGIKSITVADSMFPSISDGSKINKKLL